MIFDEFQKYIYPTDHVITKGRSVTVELKGEYLVLDFGEENVEYMKDNFEFEVYEIVTRENPNGTEDVTEELIPLQLDNTSGLPSSDQPESYYSNYLEIMTDNAIPDIFLDALGTLDNRNNTNLNTFGQNASNAMAALASALQESSNNNTYPGDNQDPEDCE